MYKELIQNATKCEASDIDEIEEYMRHIIFHSTLDWQTARQLQAAARTAWKDIQFMRSPEGITYLNSVMP